MDTNEIINELRKENQSPFPTDIFETEKVDIVSHMKQLMSERNITQSELILSICYERAYVYHVLNGTRKPSRTFLLRFAVVLKLDYEETQRLLYISGNPILYARIIYDAVIIYALERHMSPYELNELMEDVGEKPLFWTNE